MQEAMTSRHTLQTVEQQCHNLHFRSIRSDDWRRLQRFHQRLSGTTVELRFHGAKRELSEPLAHRFTLLDGHEDVAMVATTGTRGRIVGVARYCTIVPGRAEVAFVVEDEFQGHGVGRKLLNLLLEKARENGITELVAEVLPGNVRMIRLLEGVGPSETHYQGGVCEIRVDITPA